MLPVLPRSPTFISVQGILGDVSLGEFALDMVPVEEDVLSLELEGSFFSCVVEGDSTPLFYVARAMCKLQAMYGLIPRLQVSGLWHRRVISCCAAPHGAFRIVSASCPMPSTCCNDHRCTLINPRAACLTACVMLRARDLLQWLCATCAFDCARKA